MPVDFTIRSQNEPRRNGHPGGIPDGEMDDDVMSYGEYRTLCAERGVTPLPRQIWEKWCEVLGIEI